jgi:uncharacterized protein (TIGR03437 family)
MRIKLFIVQLLLCGVAFSQAPAVIDGGVLNGASFQKGQAIAPGSLISIFGSRLASKLAQADTIPLSTSLGGVSVQFVNGSVTMNAPVEFVLPDDPANQVPSQINAQVPWNLIPDGTTQTVSMIVTRDGTPSAPTSVTVSQFSPGIFANNGRAIAINQDGTLAWPANSVPGLTTHAAKPGDVIAIYANGLGALDSPVQDGHDSLDKLRNTLVKPIVTVGGISATVLFSGMTPQFPGVNQVNIVIPNAAPGNTVPLQLQIGGTTTSASITMAVTQ